MVGRRNDQMAITREQANQTKPCNARLESYQRRSGGAPVPIYCTRPEGHVGTHCDQRDGQPIEWFANSFSVSTPDAPPASLPYRKVIDVQLVQARRGQWFWMVQPITTAAHEWAKTQLSGASYVDFPFAWGEEDLLGLIRKVRQAGLSVHVVCSHEQNFSDEIFELATVEMP